MGALGLRAEQLVHVGGADIARLGDAQADGADRLVDAAHLPGRHAAAGRIIGVARRAAQFEVLGEGHSREQRHQGSRPIAFLDRLAAATPPGR